MREPLVPSSSRNDQRAGRPNFKRPSPLVFSSPLIGERLDSFVARQLPHYSKRFAKGLCARGLVLVCGKVKVGGYLLTKGDIVEVTPIALVSARPDLVTEDKSPLKVLYQDDFLLAVSKPRAMHSVVQSDTDPITLADCIAARWPECLTASDNPCQAGLIQRLDYFTSGIVLAAKNPKVWQIVHRALINQEVKKSYLALIAGDMARESLSLELRLREAAGGKGMKVCETNQKGAFPAITMVTKLASLLDRSVNIVRASAARARRHQIRVHLAYLGHPLVGDEQYGNNTTLSSLPFFSAETREDFTTGFLLHAESIALRHPVTGKPLLIQDPSPIFSQLMRDS